MLLVSRFDPWQKKHVGRAYRFPNAVLTGESNNHGICRSTSCSNMGSALVASRLYTLSRSRIAARSGLSVRTHFPSLDSGCTTYDVARVIGSSSHCVI